MLTVRPFALRRVERALLGVSLRAEVSRAPQPQRGETVSVRVDVAQLHRIPRVEEAS